MNRLFTFAGTLALTISTYSQTSPTETNLSGKNSMSVQQMLITGHTQLKMHSLMMIKQGNIKGEVNESYLPGLKITAKHEDALLRNLTAQIIGQYFILGRNNPDPEILAITENLSADESQDVRFNAIYYGLTQIQPKTPELAEKLIDIAAQEQTPVLQDRIIVSLANYQPQVEGILNEKLKSENAIAYYEIYEEFTGKEPPDSGKFLDMPSSRPHLIIIKSSNKNSEAAKKDLTELLKKSGLKSPSVEISGSDENYVLMLTTYITRDYKTAKEVLSENNEYSITQDMWLTPELEIQIEAMRKAGN